MSETSTDWGLEKRLSGLSILTLSSTRLKKNMSAVICALPSPTQVKRLAGVVYTRDFCRRVFEHVLMTHETCVTAEISRQRARNRESDSAMDFVPGGLRRDTQAPWLCGVV